MKLKDIAKRDYPDLNINILCPNHLKLDNNLQCPTKDGIKLKCSECWEREASE